MSLVRAQQGEPQKTTHVGGFFVASPVLPGLERAVTRISARRTSSYTLIIRGISGFENILITFYHFIQINFDRIYYIILKAYYKILSTL